MTMSWSARLAEFIPISRPCGHYCETLAFYKLTINVWKYLDAIYCLIQSRWATNAFCFKTRMYFFLELNTTYVRVFKHGTLKSQYLKVSKSQNKIVEPKLLPKNEPTNSFFYPEE